MAQVNLIVSRETMLILNFKNSEHPKVHLDKELITIGRDADNDISLHDARVSRKHAEILTSDKGSFITDLDSKFGTLLNGKEIKERSKLGALDIIKVGDSSIEIIDTEAHTTMIPTFREFADETGDNEIPPRNAIGPDSGEWFIQCETGELKGKQFFIEQKRLIGRDAICDIVLDSKNISRRHAEVEVAGDTLVTRDVGSSNGVFVNGEQVDEATVREGDEIKFDEFSFTVGRIGGDAEKTNIRGQTVTKPEPAQAPPEEKLSDSMEKTQAIELPKGRLVALAGSVVGTSYEITGNEITIGRAPENGVHIDDKTVSSCHAKMIQTGGGWEIADFGSTNFVYVNNEKVDRSPLRDGDKIKLGKVELKFEEAGAPEYTQKFSVDDFDLPEVPSSSSSGLMYLVMLAVLCAAAYGIYTFKVKPAGMAAAPKPVTAKLYGGKVWEISLPEGQSGPTTPALADINGDGFVDVILANAQGLVMAVDGQEGKKIFEQNVANAVLAPPGIADFSGDGVADMVIANNSGAIFAINGKGQILWQTSASLNLGSVINRPALADINGDKIPDVITPTTGRGMVALDGTRGWELWSAAELTSGKVVTSPLAADLDGDGNTDFVSVTDKGQVLAVTTRQKKVWKMWEAAIPAVSYSSPVFVKKGELKLVAAAASEGMISAFHADSGKSAWQTDLKQKLFSSPLAVRLDSQGTPGIAVVTLDGDIHMLDALTGKEVWTAKLGAPVEASPGLFDVTNDGIEDLIVLDAKGSIHIADMTTGKTVLNLKVAGADGFFASPVLGDLTNDGMVEITAASKNGLIAAYGINRSIRKGHTAWPVYLGNNRHSID